MKKYFCSGCVYNVNSFCSLYGKKEDLEKIEDELLRMAILIKTSEVGFCCSYISPFKQVLNTIGRFFFNLYHIKIIKKYEEKEKIRAEKNRLEILEIVKKELDNAR